MIITFGTQKGGVGKTTIAVALANYLTLHKERKVFVYDFDYQKSFYKLWEIDNGKENSIPPIYDVQVINNEDELPFSNMEELKAIKDSQDIYLFDLGGTLDARYNLLLVYSDIIVIPFEYSNVSIESTLVFINVITKHFETEASLLFISNRSDAGYNYPNKEYTDGVLEQYGELVPTPIYKRNALQKINTREFKKEIRNAIKPNLDELLYIINNLTENKYNL
ncbi:ParA family protein [Riemerella anatipestifer]|uniref:ParA family protein n=1 Tax=Riemerella anatipestifer TaxID=34085 RepID=UPI0021F81D23|nr:ParA family protein [Riemerella anatipestifer]MCW0488341.1 ParA family protein [Riemerella anatipestifer]